MEVHKFYWYATEDDFDDEGLFKLNLSAGRLRHRWVPTDRQSARLYLMESVEAAGLRYAEPRYTLVEVHLAEPMEDLSINYPNAVVPGLSGAVLRVPITEVMPKTPSRQAVERGVEMPLFSYRVNITSTIECSDPKQIASLEMGLMSSEQIEAMSAVEVIQAGAFQYNNPEDPESPIEQGVHDYRMGIVDQREGRCPTCSLPFSREDSANSCPGHFGHINLFEPMPKLMYLGIVKSSGVMADPLLNALNKVCFNCSKITLPTGVLSALSTRVDYVFKLNKRNSKGYSEIRSIMNAPFADYHGTKPETKAACPHCGEFSPRVQFNHRQGAFYFPLPDERYLSGAVGFDNQTVFNILENIPDEECKYLGLDYKISRPENMFFKNMPVAPNAVRPARLLPGQKSKDLDDLTKLYQDVVNANENLRKSVLEDRNSFYWRKMLYLAVSRVYDNQKRAIGSGGTSQERGYGGTTRSVSYKGLMNRLSGKRGRFRNNLQSKYVYQVSYSAITPHAALAIDEVGVPQQVAMECTVSEKVTAKNIKMLRMLVTNGPRNYPGATHIYLDGDTKNKSKGNLFRASDRTVERVIEGALVKRHIQNGDVGLFNRAPSLHRQSVLALRAKVMKTKSLAMNPTICIPFNADYDGDAMKLHFVQSPEAIAEARKLMQLDKNIIHARYGKLTVATDQDQTSGLYLLSHTNKRRKGEWNPATGLGFTTEGIPYISKSLAISCYTYVYSEIRDEKQLKAMYLTEKRASNVKMESFGEWRKQSRYRTIDTLPDSDYIAPDGSKCYTGRAIFGHLFTVLNCEYVSATFQGNTPKVDENGDIIRDGDKKVKETVVVYKGQLLQGTLEKDSFGEGGSSLAPSFIYHEGYEGGQAKLTEYIEMVTRLGYAGHRVIGYTMGVSDVGLFAVDSEGGQSPLVYELDNLYDDYATQLHGMTQSWWDKDYAKYADTQQEKIDAIVSPADFIEEKIVNAATEYENKMLIPIEDAQGSGNAMQIAVRSKARGKDSNVRQMAGSFGIALVGGKRITHGINPFRPLAHFPLLTNNKEKLSLAHPIHAGFVKSGYSKGMQPTEYWFTSSAGRRSTVESGQGNISKSGYLERKMIKAFESVVVNDKRQVVNTRTGRVINPLVGDDGLAPYHIRGSHEFTNKDGHIITIQPLLFEFNCKHGKPLENSHAEEYPEHACLECSKGSNLDTFTAELDGLPFKPSPKSTKSILDILQVREMYAADLRKLGKKFRNYYNDSICRAGESIGATAGGCLGEPATQAALRSFHFAGKLSFQGSVDRLKQMLESPLTANTNIFNPQTKIPMKEEHNSQQMVEKMATICRSINAEMIIQRIEYDLQSNLLMIKFNRKNVADLGLIGAAQVTSNQIRKALNQVSLNIGPVNFMSKLIDWNQPYVISAPNASKDGMLRAKEAIMSAKVSGITNAASVSVAKEEERIDGKFTLDIRDASNETLNALVTHLSDYLDLSQLETNNLGWIYRNFGLEACLWMFHKELDFQMNGPGGVGEYDVRYIRMIADLMGEEGAPTGLGPNGIGSRANYSILAAASLEAVPEVIKAGSVMGNFDNLAGPAESIVVGKLCQIGDFVPTDE